jgi:glycosyltransferase involved in cell wall biosynthesis
MIAPTPFFSHRGTHIRILEEARALERLGHKITIVTYHNGDDIDDYITTNIDVRRIRRWLFWYKKTEAGPDWQKVLLNFFLIVKSFNMILSKKPDILHAHLHEGVLIGRIMQVIFFLRRLPMVSDFHGSLVGEMRSHGYLGVPPFGTIFRSLERWINGMGNIAVVSGEENVSTIAQARKDKKATYLWDGVNISDYGNKCDKIELRKKYNVPKEDFVIVYTGALIENKGIRHILESIPFTIQKIPNVHFVIGGFPANWVRNYVESRNLQKYVTVVSPLNYFTLAEVNQLADVAIDPKDATVRQASGKLLQYMAAHVGIICSDRPTNHKYLSKNSAQFLSAIDAYEIMDAVERFYKDKAYLQVCADNAFEDVQKFDWQEIGKKLDKIYKMLSIKK